MKTSAIALLTAFVLTSFVSTLSARDSSGSGLTTIQPPIAEGGENRIPQIVPPSLNLTSRYDVTRLPTGGTGTIDASATQPILDGPGVAAVPEPGSTVLLLTCGALALLKLRGGSRKTRGS